jgi:hypothetical protein
LLRSIRAAAPAMSNLLPEELVVLAQSAPLSDFLTAYGNINFLLIKLDDPSGELHAGLSTLQAALSGRPQPDLNVLGFHTVVADLPMSGPRLEAPDHGVADLRHRNGQMPHYAITLDKRAAGSSYMDRISVGRARNRDIVLRHPSVSKFHAWFERDAAGTYYVADAGSKNGTRINKDETSRRELTKLKPTDVVRFGSVETVLCAPETLWKACQQG